jgi:hypothetical protein
MIANPGPSGAELTASPRAMPLPETYHYFRRVCRANINFALSGNARGHLLAFPMYSIMLDPLDTVRKS